MSLCRRQSIVGSCSSVARAKCTTGAKERRSEVLHGTLKRVNATLQVRYAIAQDPGIAV